MHIYFPLFLALTFIALFTPTEILNARKKRWSKQDVIAFNNPNKLVAMNTNGSAQPEISNSNDIDVTTLSNNEIVTQPEPIEQIEQPYISESFDQQSEQLTPEIEKEIESVQLSPQTPQIQQPLAQATTTNESVSQQNSAPDIEPVPLVQHTDVPEYIEFQFENADLQNFVKQIEDIFEITFLADDSIEPLIKGARAIKGNKISFRTQEPLTRNQAWELFVTFMQISGFAVVRSSLPRTYRITTLEAARKMPIPAYIGTNYLELPDGDELVRYVYFIENSSLETIKVIVDTLRSSSSSFILLQEQKAFILTDRAYNIKKLMEIVKEIDRTTVPQSMSLLLLRHAEARQVKELYDSISQTDERGGANKLLNRKHPTSTYFPENLRIIAEPRRNALILLGPKDATQKAEDFIKKHIDTSLNQPYSAFYTYQLKYADAATVADIMNNVSQFGKDTEAGRYGGLRGNDKYLKPMVFVPENETNQLIIKGDFEGYIRAIEVIEQLDEAPKQVAMEMLVLSVVLNDTKQLGSQIRSKDNAPEGILGNNVKFQTSGLFGTSGIVENIPADDGSPFNKGVFRLLGNLLEVVKNAGTGNTVLTLGSDMFNVWGIFQALQSVANTNALANPFLMATNKTPAKVALGEERRIQTATIFTSGEQTGSFGKDDAKLEVTIIPQINSDGMIILDLHIIFDDFVNTTNFSDATKNKREIKTHTIVADKEVLAIGGLIRTRSIDSMSQVPTLGDIPIIGWLFKNRQKIQRKENILILISTRIVDPHDTEEVATITQDRIDQYQETLGNMYVASQQKDPINKMFFEERPNSVIKNAETLMFKSRNTHVASKRQRRRRSKYQPVEETILDPQFDRPTRAPVNEDELPLIARVQNMQDKSKLVAQTDIPKKLPDKNVVPPTQIRTVKRNKESIRTLLNSVEQDLSKGHA